METGTPVYVESLLTAEEHRECSRKYTTYNSSIEYNRFFKSEFMWRYRMGQSLPQEQIDLINKRLDALLQKIKR